MLFKSQDEASHMERAFRGRAVAAGTRGRKRCLWNLFLVFKPIWLDVTTLAKYSKTEWKSTFSRLATLSSLATAVPCGFLIFGWEETFGREKLLWRQSYCDPGGDFDFQGIYDPWSPQHAFKITLAFGEMSFTQAKVIDVAWDIIFGRGGQALLSAITFLVFTKCLNRILEEPQRSVSYKTYQALVFQQPNLDSVAKISQELWSQKGWRTISAVVWMILASTYVMMFPTLTSAMTGYSSSVKPYFNDGTNKIPVDKSTFHRALYLVKDADRIEGLNLTSPYIAGSEQLSSSSSSEAYGPLDEYLSCQGDLNFYYYRNYTRFLPLRGCAIVYGLSQYIETYGASSRQNRTSKFQLYNTTYQIKEPTLDIQVFNTTPSWDPVYISEKDINGSFKDTLMYTTTNSTMWWNASAITAAGSCDNESAYQWGFSFILLFVFYVLTWVWILGMYIMWEDAFWYSKLDRARRQMGFHRGVIDVSNSMWKDMLREPGELSSEADIKKMLLERKNGGRIAYDELMHYELPEPRKSDLKRFREKIVLLNGWTKTWRVTHWLWLLILSSAGIVLAFLAIYGWTDYWLLQGDSPVVGWVVACTLAPFFSIVPIVLICIGVWCTLRRWVKAIVRLMSSSKLNHTQIPGTETVSENQRLVPEFGTESLMSPRQTA